MSRVYIVRHAQAEPGLRDHARTLTQYGKLQVQLMGQWLKLNLHELDLAIVSSARRTQQTFEGFELGQDIAKVTEDQAYNASSETLEKLIRELGAGHEDVMIVAHNPGVSDLANKAGYPQPLPPGSCVILEFDDPISEFVPETAHVALWHHSKP